MSWQGAGLGRRPIWAHEATQPPGRAETVVSGSCCLSLSRAVQDLAVADLPGGCLSSVTSLALPGLFQQHHRMTLKRKFSHLQSEGPGHLHGLRTQQQQPGWSFYRSGTVPGVWPRGTVSSVLRNPIYTVRQPQGRPLQLSTHPQRLAPTGYPSVRPLRLPVPQPSQPTLVYSHCT